MPSSSADKELHRCPWSGCGRRYKRLDHLERHRKSHLGDLNYRCHICSRQYSRSDVLNRHLVQTHGEEPARIGRPRLAACMACVADGRACDGVPPRVCSRCRDKMRSCRYRHLEAEAQSQEHAPPNIVPTVHAPAVRDSHPFQPPDGFSDGSPDMLLEQLRRASTENIYGQHPATSPVAPLVRQETVWGSQGEPSQPIEPQDDVLEPVPWLTDFILSATNPNSILPMLNLEESGFDWGFTDLNTDIFEPISDTTVPDFPPAVAADRDCVSAEKKREDELRVAVFPEEVDGRSNHPPPIPDGQPSDSTWPAADRPQTPEPDIHLPAPPAQIGSVELATTSKEGVTSTARTMMQTLTQHAHHAMWAVPDLTNFPSKATLTACVDLYLAHFAGWLPIVDSPRGNFIVENSAALLLKAVAAIGSVYSRDGTERLGFPLAELVRRDLLFICEHDQRFQHDVGVVQSSLLQAYFGLYSGSPKLGERAEMMRGSLIASAKRMHLLNANISAVAHVRRAGADQGDIERALKQDHRRRRLGWSIFLYDSQAAALFGQQPAYPLAEIDAPLPTVAPDERPDSVPFAQVMATLLDKGTLVPQHLDDIAYSCIAYTLYRLCLDAASLQCFAPARSNGYKYTLSVPTYKLHPQAILDQLARHTLRSAAPTHLIVSCTALAHHAHMAFTEPGFLDQLRVAAGRRGTEASHHARHTLEVWMHANAAATRNIFAHAAMLFCLMSRFVFDTPPEHIWLFDAALSMWACVRFGRLSEARVQGDAVGISWMPTPPLDSWVEKGDSAVAVQGLGRVPGLTGESVLQAAADRLEVMSWGLAARYRRVLLGLIEEAG